MIEDDYSSASTSTISSDDDQDFDDDDESIDSSDSEDEGFVDRIESFAVQGNSPALAQLVFATDVRLSRNKNQRASNSSVTSLRSLKSNTTLNNYEAPPVIVDANLFTPE